MQSLMKNVYLLDNKGIKNDIGRLWAKYQNILDEKKPDWVKINEARAILYFLGHLFPEKIALESLERRIKFVQPKLSLDDFLYIIDSRHKEKLKKYHNNELFNRLKEFYLIVKSVKNRVNRDGSYLDENTFNKIYAKLKPKNYI